MKVEPFNLGAPPRFRGLDPLAPVEIYHRHLPHWRQHGATYFVTFRLRDSLPQAKLALLRRIAEVWKRTPPKLRTKQSCEDYATNVFRLVESWLDQGYGACYFKDPTLSAPVHDALLHFQNDRYIVGCFVIMPNHCHVVVRPLDDWRLERILQRIKGVTANRVNALMGSRGSLWQDESFDRIIRDEEHLWRVVQYIGRNPTKARLNDEVGRRWIHPDWIGAGWNFTEE